MHWEIVKLEITVGFRQYSTPFVRTTRPEIKGINKLANFGNLSQVEALYNKCKELQKFFDSEKDCEWNASGYDFLRVISSDEVWIGEYVDEYTAEVRNLAKYLDEGEFIISKIRMSDFLVILNYYIEFLSGELHRKLDY